MLVPAQKLMLDAFRGGYALGAFNTYNLETTQGIIKAAEAQRSPAVIQVSETTLAYAGFKTMVAIVKTLIEESDAPFALHLDHGKSYEMVVRCINAGFSSVMIDGSSLSFEDNVCLLYTSPSPRD